MAASVARFESGQALSGGKKQRLPSHSPFLALYEGKTGIGRLVLAAADDPNVEYVVRLASLVPLSEARWARKLLQMATAETALIVEYHSISGLGRVSDVSAPPFCVEFLDHHQWDFRCGEQVLLRSQFGEVRLPQEPISKERFIDNMRRVFQGIGEPAIARFRIVLDLLAQLRHGSSLVIATDAAEETQRLVRQGDGYRADSAYQGTN